MSHIHKPIPINVAAWGPLRELDPKNEHLRGRVPQVNGAVPWGPPPSLDPKDPPPPYPGVSAKKFNPLEAQKVYAETISREKSYGCMHQVISIDKKLPHSLGNERYRPGQRGEDIMPGHGSLQASFEYLGFENIGGRVVQKQPGEERPVSSASQQGYAHPAEVSWHSQLEAQLGSYNEGGVRRPRSAASVGRSRPQSASECRDSGALAHQALQSATISERAANRAGMQGQNIKRCIRPASAPAISRPRCGVQPSRPSWAAAQRPMSGKENWRRESSRGRVAAAQVEIQHCQKLFKERMGAPLTLF